MTRAVHSNREVERKVNREPGREVNRISTALKILCLALGAIGGIGGMAGCATPPFGAGTPVYDANFGTAVRQVRAAQVLDPEATARNLGKTTELDAAASKNATDRYQDSFKEPPPTFSVFGAPVQRVTGSQ